MSKHLHNEGDDDPDASRSIKTFSVVVLFGTIMAGIDILEGTDRNCDYDVARSAETMAY